MRSEKLLLTPSNVTPEGDGPPVVWLTSDYYPETQYWANYTTQVNKRVVRITVDVPDWQPWLAWSRSHHIKEDWHTVLSKTGGNLESWYVVEREIPSTEWLSIGYSNTSEVLWKNEVNGW